MIPLMNLDRQYHSLKNELDKVALDVLHSGAYIMGNEVETFEKEFAYYVGAKYAIGVGNGTDALVIALKALGIGPGDEVVTTAMSFFATAEAIASVGATSVFADIDVDTYTLDPSDIEKRITERTKAILPVHLYGQCADMDAIREIADRHDLFVVEDAAQAAGAAYHSRRAGSLGNCACFSFFPTKNLGCAGDGGIITTDSEDLYRKCRAYRVHGSGTDGWYLYGQRHKNTESMDFGDNQPKYYNFTVGFNSRLDAIQAAILRKKLEYLDGWNARRNEIAKLYREGICNSHVRLPKMADNCWHIFYVFPLLVDDREAFRRHLSGKGIVTGVYFPVPLHLQKAFEPLGYHEGDFPNAEYLAAHGCCIPMFPELTDEEIETVIEAVNFF